jgi:hypothetical protein
MTVMRKSTPALLVCLSFLATQTDRGLAQPADPSLQGYGYLTHSAGPDLWSVGNAFTILTVADPGDVTYIPMDNVANQYTVVLENLVVASVTPWRHYLIVEFETGMLFSAYEDSRTTGTAADFGTTGPPNATAPATFVDGTQIVTSGTASEEAQLYYDLDNGTMNFYWDEGLPLRNCALLGPAFEHFFWIFGYFQPPDGSANPPVVMPAPGYAFSLYAQGECENPLQERASTWGRVKAFYR